MAENKENCIEWLTGQDKCSCTISHQKYISKIKNLAEKCPDDVKIIAENDDGTIYVRMPLKYAIKFSKPKTVNLTDEQKEECAERMRRAREMRNNM